MTMLGLIYAQARNGVIGKDNQLPWHLPEDLAHFKALTLGSPVIMGRKTWESLPPKFRPLPGRTNVVVTRQDTWHADGAHRAASLADALALCAGSVQAWVIGGAELFKDALAIADRLEVTEIDADFEGDVFMLPPPPHWRETARESQVSANGLAYSFISYVNAQRCG